MLTRDARDDALGKEAPQGDGAQDMMSSALERATSESTLHSSHLQDAELRQKAASMAKSPRSKPLLSTERPLRRRASTANDRLRRAGKMMVAVRHVVDGEPFVGSGVFFRWLIVPRGDCNGALSASCSGTARSSWTPEIPDQQPAGIQTPQKLRLRHFDRPRSIYLQKSAFGGKLAGRISASIRPARHALSSPVLAL
ncbi:hypothetical protein SAMN02927900_04218 [Rhizobium mongolense subsp. loessense]|uniref:Uncharacterized protein n=1 Tax=Rhizobium mongolense subsp. loessense TaxID=158890 RepID=A0A1G4SX80_9HYPH|nr:hypothetical protein SAMN02927900_04218 [Rhizobium mongolense subsp. loessense]